LEKHIEERAVRDVMTRAPETVGPRTGLLALKALFETHDFNAVPVVDDNGALLGLVTKLDFLKMFSPDRQRWIPDLRSIWGERVEDIMSRGIVAVSPDDTVATAADLMVQSKLRSLPVVEGRGRGQRLVGIVSRSDLMKCLLLDDEDPPEERPERSTRR
jgi:CBS domain-containing protein